MSDNRNMPESKKAEIGNNANQAFRELTRKEIFALTPKEADAYWKNWRKWKIENIHSKTAEEKRAYNAELKVQSDKKRKRENHMKFVLAGYALSNEPETVKRFFTWAETQELTGNEKIGLAEMKEKYSAKGTYRKGENAYKRKSSTRAV